MTRLRDRIIRDYDDGSEGKRRKQAGMSLVEANERAVWTEAAHRAFEQLAARPYTFTADDVWDLMDAWGYGEPHHPNVKGTVCSWARKNHIVVQVDEVHARRKKGHSRKVPLYLGTQWADQGRPRPWLEIVS